MQKYNVAALLGPENSAFCRGVLSSQLLLFRKRQTGLLQKLCFEDKKTHCYVFKDLKVIWQIADLCARFSNTIRSKIAMFSSKLSRESLLTNNNLFFTPLKCSHSIFCLMNSPKLPALFPVNCSLSFRKIVFISNNNFISTPFTCLPASFY